MGLQPVIINIHPRIIERKIESCVLLKIITCIKNNNQSFNL